MVNDYARAWDALSSAIGAALGTSHGSLDDIEQLPAEQQLKVIEITALLSIAQEISAFNPNNTIHFGPDGKRNGWGLPME